MEKPLMMENVTKQIPARKRKIDKDGFVTPLTPEMKFPGCEGDGYTPDLSGISPDLKMPESFITEQTSESPFSDNLNNDPEKSSTECLKMNGQNLKNYCLNWASLFESSEKFELLCPNKLDNMLKEARELEENLKQQKMALHQRLKVLSNTLKLEQ